MKKLQQNEVLSQVASASFVPRFLSGIVQPVHQQPMFTVSAAIIEKVFGDQPIPFPLNADGSADAAVYEAWIKDIGAQALQDLADFSDIDFPDSVTAL